MEDFLVKIASENDKKMIVTDAVTGRKTTTTTTEVIVVNGRIAKETPGIVCKSNGGVFYNPVLVAKNGNKKDLYSTGGGGSFYKTDGTTVQIASYDGIIDKRNLVLPTIISNAIDDSPKFYSLVAAGDNAMKLASAPIGSSVHVVGEIRDCWVGKFSVKVLWVFDMTLRKKGTYENAS